MNNAARRPRRTLALALGAALLLLAGLITATSIAPRAAAAASPSDAMIFEKTLEVGPGKVGDGTVKCPEGQRVLGGGIGQTEATSPTFGYVEQSSPVDETGSIASTKSGDVGRGWSAAVFNNSGAGSREYRLYAICSARSDATIATNPFTVEPRTVDGASIDCPDGTRAVGGGVGQPGPTSPLFGWLQGNGPVDVSGTTANTESGDTAAGWYASVFNFGATTRDFQVFAICSSASDAAIAAKALSVAPGEVADATVSCPSGTRVVGGGVGQVAGTDAPRGYIQQSLPVDSLGRTISTESGDVGRSWLASVYNPPEAGAPTREFRVFAICAGDGAATPKPTTPATTPKAPKALCAGNVATKAGTEGNDVLTGTPGRDVIAGLGGNDSITGLGGNDLVCGGPGADKIVGGSGDDYLIGDDGADRITAGAGRDTVFGGGGRDNVDGGADDDRIYGGDANDVLRGGSGPDRIYGEAGDDRLEGGPGADTLDGGPGRNRVHQ
jgi:Ca2+-binding RTX toxin-like protein